MGTAVAEWSSDCTRVMVLSLVVAVLSCVNGLFVDGGDVSAKQSRRCAGVCRNRRKRAFATSAMVLVIAQNAGGDWVQPIGSVRGKATIGDSPRKAGMEAASLGISSSRNHTR